MPKKALSSRLANLEREFIISGGKWSAFSIDDLFDISSPKKKFNANKLEFDGVHPYVVRSEKNNGIKGYINEDEKYLNPGCTISFGQDTATMFFQDKPYFTGDKIKIFSLKGKRLNSYIASYLISSMKRSFSTFSWGSSSFDEKILKQVKITIPQMNGFPSWDYMKLYIEKLEAERIEELEGYLRVTGLNNYHLSENEISCINYLDISSVMCRGGGWLLILTMGDALLQGSRYLMPVKIMS